MRRKVCSKVKELLLTGQLSEHDYEWITKLSEDLQYPAAYKCIHKFKITMSRMDNPKSCLGTRVTVN